MSVDCLFCIDSPTPIMFFEGCLRICAVEMIIIIIDAFILCAVCCFVYGVFVILFECFCFMCAVFFSLFFVCGLFIVILYGYFHFVCGFFVLCLFLSILCENCFHFTPLSPCYGSALFCAERTQQEIPLKGGLSERRQPDCGEQQTVQW